MKEVGEEGAADGDGEAEKPRKRQTLLQRFKIPIDQVDFKYVETCTDGKKLERILLVLRSGEEGFYPDLEKCVALKLGQVDPTHRLLRQQHPILRPGSLEPNQRAELESDLSDWIKSTTTDRFQATSGSSNSIFESDELNELPVPIRGTTVITKSDTAKSLKAGGGTGDIPFLKPANPNRIKSWEYDKWNKFNADAELMKLDIQDMQAEEADRVRSFKATNQAKVPGNSKSVVDVPDVKCDKSPRPCSSKSILGNSAKVSTKQSQSSAPLGRSFIEEIPNDPVDKKCEPKRRVKITIDDINVGGF